MHSQNLKTVRDACIRANPQILELGFGCEIIGPFGKAIVLAKAKEHIEGAQKFVGQRYSVLRGRTSSFYARVAIKEILGRKIGLADVLLAIDYHSNTHNIDVPKFFDVKEDMPNQALFLVGKIVYAWNLPKDDLNLQSEPTVQFLADLLASNTK
jgi:hypothetical protein